MHALLYLQVGRMPWVRLRLEFLLVLYSISRKESCSKLDFGRGLLLERFSSSLLNWLITILPTAVNLFLTLEQVSLSQRLTQVCLQLFKISEVFYYEILFLTVVVGFCFILF